MTQKPNNSIDIDMEIAFAILAMSVRRISSVGWIEHQLLLKYLSYIVHCQDHFFWGIWPLHLSYLSKFMIATPFTQESPFLDSILDVLGIQWIRLDLQEIKKSCPKTILSMIGALGSVDVALGTVGVEASSGPLHNCRRPGGDCCSGSAVVVHQDRGQH